MAWRAGGGRLLSFTELSPGTDTPTIIGTPTKGTGGRSGMGGGKGSDQLAEAIDGGRTEQPVGRRRMGAGGRYA